MSHLLHESVNFRTRSKPDMNAGVLTYADTPSAPMALAQRVVDVVVASAILIVFAPFFAILCGVVYLSDPGAVFFMHPRVGRDGRMFYCLKFRTMVRDAEARLQAILVSDPEALAEWRRDHKIRNDPRVTAVGTFLRKSSLDELPQLLNVLQGTMSLVGPRPIVPAECARYGRYFTHYCSVKPGITGLWQISGRNDVSYRRRVACDVLYSRKKSVVYDFMIMVMTGPSVALKKGAY